MMRKFANRHRSVPSISTTHVKNKLDFLGNEANGEFPCDSKAIMKSGPHRRPPNRSSSQPSRLLFGRCGGGRSCERMSPMDAGGLGAPVAPVAAAPVALGPNNANVGLDWLGKFATGTP